MEDRIMNVIQRADGKFYWKHQSVFPYSGYYVEDVNLLWVRENKFKI